MAAYEGIQAVRPLQAAKSKAKETAVQCMSITEYSKSKDIL